MKAAVAHLEQFMEKAETRHARQDRARHGEGRRARHRQEPGRDHPRRTTATGSSTSGIKVPPEQLIAAVREHKPDIIGLSGLLVKSRAADGGHRAGPARGRHRDPAPRGRRGAHPQLHRHAASPPSYGGARGLRAGRDGRPRPGQPALRRRPARRAASSACAREQAALRAGDAAEAAPAPAARRGGAARAVSRDVPVPRAARPRAARAARRARSPRLSRT